MGVAVTFIAILELMREGLIDIVQTERTRRCTCAPRRRAHCGWWPRCGGGGRSMTAGSDAGGARRTEPEDDG